MILPTPPDLGMLRVRTCARWSPPNWPAWASRTWSGFPGRTTWSRGYGEPGRAFRAIPSEVEPIVANLAIANMDFSEFADYADEDGVFRGF